MTARCPDNIHPALKLLLIEAFKRSKISKQEFAQRLGRNRNAVERLLDARMSTSLDSFDRAFAALGVPMPTQD